MLLEGMNAYDSDAGSSIDPMAQMWLPILCRVAKIRMRLKRSQMTKAVKRKNSTGSLIQTSTRPLQKSKRQRAVSPASESFEEIGDGASDLESFVTDRDELLGPSGRRRGFKRPRIEWELVSSWNKDHVTQEDYEGEIARIMAKSLWDSKTAVSPKYNAKAISDFRYKTVRLFQFYSAH